MHSELKILVVAYSFPPDAEVAAKRAAGFCRYLPACGIQPTVLTVQDRFYKLRDESFPKPSSICVERTTVVTNPLDWYSRWKAGAQSVPGSGNDSALRPGRVRHDFLRRHILALLQTPDPYWGWFWPALRAAERLIEREPIAAILSTAPPWTGHLVARHLRRKYRIPWLADFRDPWTSSLGGEEKLPPWAGRINFWLEQSCVRWADLVVSVTDAMRQNFTRRYPTLTTAKFVTLTNGYDDFGGLSPSAASASLAQSQRKRLLLHLGDLYGGRRIDTFCQALVRLVKSGKLDPGSFKVLFLGNIDRSIAAAAHQLAPELIRNNCLEFGSRVNWQRSQETLSKAELLLLFQGGYRQQVPAKFYEYLQTGKPIFAVTEEGALTELLQSTSSGIWADPENPADVGTKLLEALALPARAAEEVQRNWTSRYHYQSLTVRLAGWVRELVNGGVKV